MAWASLEILNTGRGPKSGLREALVGGSPKLHGDQVPQLAREVMDESLAEALRCF